MYLFYGDETNLNAKENEFFIYGGIAIPGDRALELSHVIDNIRGNAAIQAVPQPASQRLPSWLDADFA